MGAAKKPVHDSSPNMDEAAHRAGVTTQRTAQATPAINTGIVEAIHERNTTQGIAVRQPGPRHMRKVSFWQKIFS